MFSFFTSLVAGPLGPFVKIFGKYVLGLAIIGGFIWFVYNSGYKQAQLKCNAHEIQARLDAELIKEKDIQNQLNDALKIQSQINSIKDKIQQNASKARDVVNHEVKDNAACAVNGPIIGVLNTLRAPQASNSSN